jgi:hypothetical protein
VERDINILRAKESFPKKVQTYMEGKAKDPSYSDEFGYMLAPKTVGVSGEIVREGGVPFPDEQHYF